MDFFFISRVNDSNMQTKLCLHIMNQHTFLKVFMLKYHLKYWCIVIYETVRDLYITYIIIYHYITATINYSNNKYIT